MATPGSWTEDAAYRRPPASFAEAGSARSRHMATQPAAGPRASRQKAPGQPASATACGTAWMLASVSRKPVQGSAR